MWGVHKAGMWLDQGLWTAAFEPPSLIPADTALQVNLGDSVAPSIYTDTHKPLLKLPCPSSILDDYAKLAVMMRRLVSFVLVLIVLS